MPAQPVKNLLEIKGMALFGNKLEKSSFFFLCGKIFQKERHSTTSLQKKSVPFFVQDFYIGAVAHVFDFCSRRKPLNVGRLFQIKHFITRQVHYLHIVAHYSDYLRVSLYYNRNLGIRTRRLEQIFFLSRENVKGSDASLCAAVLSRLGFFNALYLADAAVNQNIMAGL